LGKKLQNGGTCNIVDVVTDITAKQLRAVKKIKKNYNTKLTIL